MFEKDFHVQLSVSFSFFSNSGTTYCLHCSYETIVPVIFLFNASSLLEIASLWKGRGLKYSTCELTAAVDKSNGYHMESYRKFPTLSKARREKLECLKDTRTDPSNNNNSLSGFLDACSSVTKRSDIKSPKPSKTGIFPNVSLFCNKSSKRI